jgi:hypothetical protein
MLNDIRFCDELFHTSDGVAFADFITDGHRETWPIRSKRFRTWMRRCYYRATGAAPGAAVLGPVLDLLEARTQFDGPERVVHTRIAEHAGHLYVDLADERWREIGPDGWQVLGSPPVRFRRRAGMLPLPVPERGESIEALRPFLNIFEPARLCAHRRIAARGLATNRPPLTGATLGSTSSLRSFDTTVLAEPCSPDIAGRSANR